MKLKTLVADKLSDRGVEFLKKKCSVTVKTGMNEKELVKEISRYDAMIVRSATKVTPKVIKAAKKLKIIARAGVGVDNIDIDAATQAGIVVVNSPTGNILAAAELAMSHIFALARNIPQANMSMHQCKWEKKLFMGTQVAEKTLGIVGFGKIGQLVGRAAAGVGMNLLIYDPLISEELASNAGGRLVSMDELLRNSDFITLHVPKSERTYHLISKKEFKKMKSGVRIVNCSRGGVIDEEALVDAIKKGKVAGAALDVFEKEPPGRCELIEMPNVIMTPHLGASTQEAQINVALDVARQVVAFFEGEFPTSAVNMPSIKPEIMETHQPYFELARKLGVLHSGLISGTVGSVEIRYQGSVSKMQTELITRYFLVGLLQSRYDEVNVVNAQALLEDRGVDLSVTASDRMTRFADYITARVITKDEAHEAGGTLTVNNMPRIVDIDGYAFDLAPEGLVLLATHHDQPGVIGKVGMLLGKKDINIAGMQVGRESVRGNAIMALNLDDEVTPEVMKTMKRYKEIKKVYMISF